MIKKIISGVCLFLFLVFILAPFFLTVLFFGSRSGFLCEMVNIFRFSKIFHTGIWNSLLYAVFITAGQFLVSVSAAYTFSCFQFKGRDILFTIVLIVMMMPHQVTVVPDYIILKKFQLINTRGAVILPQIFAPFCVFLLRQNMIHTDKAILEAAEIDGAASFRRLVHIVIPVNKGGIFALLLLKISENWSLYEAPVSFATDNEIQPLNVLITFFYKSLDITDILIVSLLMCIPILIFYFIFSNSLVEGLGQSAFK